MSALRADLIAAVDRSPDAAAAHDRERWVALFTCDGRVEDPVGSRPHIGPQAIGRFYDTFIAPRAIVFDVGADIVCGPTVIRDVVLEVGMGPVVTMRIPAVLRYDLRALAGEWRLERLRAYWELPAMMMQFAGNGAAAGPQGMALARALLANQGLRGTLGFTAGFGGPWLRGKRTVRALLEAVAVGDERRAQQMLTQGATITRIGRTALTLNAFREAIQHRTPTRFVAAGSSVAVSMAGPAPAVLIAELVDRGRGVSCLTVFAE